MGNYGRVEEIILAGMQDGSMEKWMLAGATEAQLAEFLGVSYSQFRAVKKTNSAVSTFLQRTRKKIIPEVWTSLVRQALGYHEKTTDKHKRKKTLANGQVEIVEEATERDVYIAPNPKACSMVLLNYMNMQSKGQEGLPDEYIVEPRVEQLQKDGRLPELQEALSELFFTRGKNG